VLGPLLFTTYVSPVGELIESYGIYYHQFVDDTQLLVTTNSTDVSLAIDRLAHCSAAVRRCFLLNGLQLNAGKSEVVFLGTTAQLRSGADVTTIDVAESNLEVAPQLKSLGVIIDSHLRFDSHAKNVRHPGVQFPYPRPSPSAWFSYQRCRPNGGVQYCQFKT